METTHSHERLKKFVKHELAQIEKPGNPGQAHRFTDPQRLAKALCDFLAQCNTSAAFNARSAHNT